MPPTRRSTRPAAAAAAAATAPYTRADTHNSESDSPAPRAKTRNVRSTRNPRTVIEPDSDEDEEMEDDDVAGEELNLEPEDDEMEDDDSDELDEDGDEDIDEDDELSKHPPPPEIKTQSNSKGRPSVVVKPPSEGTLKSVEAREMEAIDDEDLSDLESEGLEQELNLNDDNEEPGDDDDDDDLDGEDDEIDDDDDDDSDRSRSGTPDLTKLTRRQRGQFEEFDGNLLALSNEAQKKKHISAEEHAMRRAEMARRRKNLSEKRNEEEKIDTINKLLKKPAPKRRTRAEILAAQAAGEGGTPGFDEDGDEIKPDPIYVRWVNNSDGSRIGVPDEWLSAPIGRPFASEAGNRVAPSRGAKILVEEVA